MRVAMMLVVLVSACAVDGGTGEGDREETEIAQPAQPSGGIEHLEVEQPDAGGQISAPDYGEACGQLVADDDKLCSLACTDWHAFAALATPGECAHATCPLLDGRTFYPSVCVDPH